MKTNATTSIPLIAAWVMMLGALPCAAFAQNIAKPNDRDTVGAGRGFVNPIQGTAPPERQVSSALTAQDTDKANHLTVGQPPKIAPVAVMPPSKVPIDTDSAINPLTGKSFSEERLTRLLNANKLLTDIYRQQVSQAQLQTELELTGDRRQAESAKLRSEAINIIPKPTVPVKESLKAGEELIASRGQRPIVSDQAKLDSTPSTATAAAQVLPQQASGTLKIGPETFQAQSTYSGPQAKIVYVDAQPIVQRNNSPSGSNTPFQPITNPGPNFMNSGSTQFPPNFIPNPIPR